VNMQATQNESYPIRTVAEITGVNAVTLRAWERRYGLIRPSRTPKGHRMYSRRDIELIQEILDRLAQGMSISQITREILDKSSADVAGAADNSWSHYSRRMIQAIVRFDERALDATYNDAMSLYPVEIVTAKLVMPLLEELGDRWENQIGSVAEEHFFSVYLRNKLGARFHHQNLKNSGPKLIVACLPGEHHEFGILLFALTAHSKGFQIILLGSNLPAGELKHVADRTGSEAIVLAGSASFGCDGLIAAISALTEEVAIPVFIGGKVSSLCHDDIARVNAVPLGHDLARSILTVSNKLNRLT